MTNIEREAKNWLHVYVYVQLLMYFGIIIVPTNISTRSDACFPSTANCAFSFRSGSLPFWQYFSIFSNFRTKQG